MRKLDVKSPVYSQTTTESLIINPTYMTLTLWSTGLNPCAVFPFLLCCKLSQSYSTSGFPISLQNVHIQSPLKRNRQLVPVIIVKPMLEKLVLWN